MPVSLPTNPTDPFKNNLRKFLSPFICYGFYSIYPLKWILHPKGKTVSKKLVYESKAIMYWQKQDKPCQTETQLLSDNKPNCPVKATGEVSKEKAYAGLQLCILGLDAQVSHAAAVSQFPQKGKLSLSFLKLCVCSPWHQIVTCKVAKCCC